MIICSTLMEREVAITLEGRGALASDTITEKGVLDAFVVESVRH